MDEDSGQTHSYTFTSNPGNKFIIVNGKLQTRVALDYETQKEYVIGVKTTDSGKPAKSFQKAFTIKVVDVNEPPQSVSLDNYDVRYLKFFSLFVQMN